MEFLFAAQLFVAPIISQGWLQLIVIAAGLLLTLVASGSLVKFFILPRNFVSPKKDKDGPRFDSSVVIGKCENILVFVFVLFGQEPGLAIIFAAKALARADDIKKNPGFFLGGTMVNLIWAMFMAYIVRILVLGI